MKNLFLILLFVGCKQVVAPQDSSRVVERISISFEDYSQDDQISSQFPHVIFSTASGLPRILSRTFDPLDTVPVSGDFILGGTHTTGFYKDDPLYISFLGNVSNITLYVIDLETPGVVEVSNQSGEIIDVIPLSPMGTGEAQLVTIQGARTIKIYNNSNFDGFMIDDLSFER